MEVRNEIIKTIQQHGPLSFRDFMMIALYNDPHGYYTSSASDRNQYGDYYTSPCITSLFGGVIAKQMEELWYFTGSGPFTIVEYGAGDGRLCRDILKFLEPNREFYSKLKYIIIEKGAWNYSEKFPEMVSTASDINGIAGFTGCIISNELLDNLPFHRITMQREVMEIFVDYEDGFSEVLLPAGSEINEYLGRWNIHLEKGFNTEINLDIRAWLKEAAGALGRGYMITIDYGYPAHELYSEKRKDGTLMCYSGHRCHSDPYAAIGQSDITSHVNFSALAGWGKEFGLENCGMVTQSEFLLNLGFKQLFIDKYCDTNNLAQAAMLQSRLNRLLLLEMGNSFKVLVQKKGDVPGNVKCLS